MSLFTYVNDADIDSFLENQSNYENRIAFLGTTGEIAAKNNIYGKNHGNSKIFYGICDSGDATTEKAVACNDFTKDDLVEGVMVIVKFTYTNSAAVADLALNVNNTGVYNIKKIYSSSTSSGGNTSLANLTLVKEILAGSIIPFIFNGTYWVIAGVDMNVNSTYSINYSYDAGQYKAGSGTYAVTRYSLLLQKPDGTWEKTTATSAQYTTATSKTVNTNGFLLNQIVYYATTTLKANGALLAANTCYRKAASVNLQYSTNCGSSPGWAIGDYIYLIGSIGSDGLFYLDTTTWWSNTLPTTNDGKLYIRLGLVLENNTTDHLPTTNISFFDERPIFYHDGEKICQYLVADNKQDVIADLDTIRSNASAGADKVSNVQSDWNEIDNTSQSYILNKPNIPSMTGLATEQYVDTAVAGIVNSAPDTLDTLNELATALGNDPNFATTIAGQIGEKVSKTELSNQSYVTTTMLSAQSYLKSFTESDPTVPSYVKEITESDIAYWNTKQAPDFIVTATSNSESEITTDYSVSDVISAARDKKNVILLHHNLRLPAVFCTEDFVIYCLALAADEQLNESMPTSILTVVQRGTTATVTEYDFNPVAFNGETDPTVPSYVKNITEANISDWNDKVSKTELSSQSYVSTTQLINQSYVTTTALSNQSYITSNQLSAQAYLKSFTETDPTVPTYVKNIKENNISNWNAYQANVIETISVNSSNVNPINKNVNIVIPTLSKGTTSGNGNAVTDISVNGHEITLSKGSTFLENHQSIKLLNNVSLSGSTDNITLTIVKEQTPETGFLATYKLKQGDTQIGASINIPKDYLIKSGEVKTVTTANTPYTGAAVGDKYLDFIVNVTEGTASDTHMYIPVNDLVDVYTEGNGIDISNSNVVSIQIDSTNANGLATTSNGLKLGLASGSSAGAMSSNDFTKLSGIPSISSANNGQILQVVNGAWALVSPVTVYTGSDAPNNNNGNNGDIYLQS